MTTAKEGAPDEVVNRKINEIRATKNNVPAIQAIIMARNLGWAGPANVVTMTVDVKDKAEFDALLASLTHCEVANKAVETFRTDNSVMA